MTDEQHREQLIAMVVLALNDVKPGHTAEEVKAGIDADPECIKFFERLQRYIIQAAAISPAGFELVAKDELTALRDMAWRYARVSK